LNHPCLVPFDHSFKIASAPSSTPEGVETADGEKPGKRLGKVREELKNLQQIFYADHRYSLLLVFQAMDAAGKDSTIREVISGLDPAGFIVTSFKQPTAVELDHDFLWRTVEHLPKRGHISVFNRSYYEEVITVRVHPEYLDKQHLPLTFNLTDIWKHRYESIQTHEQHLARNGTVIIKFWLNISPEEQRLRLLARLDKPDKNWKFAAGDLEARRYWKNYLAAYEETLNTTSTPWAPWYAIPADNKPLMRLTVAEIIRDTLKTLPLHYPEIHAETLQKFRRTLEENPPKKT
jgi:PPK2 family polyphosphate:nucleotide phosphotransferase